GIDCPFPDPMVPVLRGFGSVILSDCALPVLSDGTSSAAQAPSTNHIEWPRLSSTGDLRHLILSDPPPPPPPPPAALPPSPPLPNSHLKRAWRSLYPTSSIYVLRSSLPALPGPQHAPTTSTSAGSPATLMACSSDQSWESMASGPSRTSKPP